CSTASSTPGCAMSEATEIASTPAADIVPGGPALDGSAVAAAPARRRLGGSWGIGFWLAVTWITVLGLVLVLVPFLPLEEPNRVSADLYARPGEAGHLFGADEVGRDLL